MSLATRCPACGTVFRLVRDQLVVSDGWVRCGRCMEVFDAGAASFQLDTPPGAAAPAGTAASPGSAAVDRTREKPQTGPEPAAPTAPPAAGPMAASAEAAASPNPAAAIGPAPSLAAELPAAESQAALPRAAESPASESQAVEPPAPEPRAAEPPGAEPQAAAEPAEQPEFIRRADRAERWQQPRRRGLVALLCLLLLVLLALQAGWQMRETLAVAAPATRPALESACALLGCRIGAPRRIDSVAVDSHSLLHVEGGTLYRLSLVVHNHAATAVRMPAIELSLSDSQGRTLARRVLAAAELGHSADSLPPRGEAALQALLDLGDQRVAGYTVELFYP